MSARAKILFVTPVESGSGETISALHAADRIAARGGSVAFVSSTFASRFLIPKYRDVLYVLTNSREKNGKIWMTALQKFRPDCIVFADYPLMYFSSGSARIMDREKLADHLQRLDCRLASFDHAFWGQKGRGMYFGPSHLSFCYETWPDVPESMALYLPCPMHEPRERSWRKGMAYRNWDVPRTLTAKRRRAIRAEYLEDGRKHLIFHSIPDWAVRMSRRHRLPLYKFLGEILEYHLGNLAGATTLVSVNKGKALRQTRARKLRIVNLPYLEKTAFEELQLSADLYLTENRVSLSMGKAICGLIPSVVMRNTRTYRELVNRLSGPIYTLITRMEGGRPGSIYPFDIYPSGGQREFETLGLYRENSLVDCFFDLELFDEDETPDRLQEILTDRKTRNALREKQYRYVDRVGKLPDIEQLVRKTLEDQ